MSPLLALVIGILIIPAMFVGAMVIDCGVHRFGWREDRATTVLVYTVSIPLAWLIMSMIWDATR